MAVHLAICQGFEMPDMSHIAKLYPINCILHWILLNVMKSQFSKFWTGKLQVVWNVLEFLMYGWQVYYQFTCALTSKHDLVLQNTPCKVIDHYEI